MKTITDKQIDSLKKRSSMRGFRVEAVCDGKTLAVGPLISLRPNPEILPELEDLLNEFRYKVLDLAIKFEKLK